jgi:hydroxymethylpyrimidine/phosphomethylpyrimidine kinase
MKVALTIGGSDPSGGAGIQSDLNTFRDMGVRGLSVVSAVTAQNSSMLDSKVNIPSSFLIRQIEVILNEFRPISVKTGMLGNANAVGALARFLKGERGLCKNLVIDPVMASSSGFMVIDEQGIKGLKRLISLSLVVTPNIMEAQALSGVCIKDVSDMEAAARRIYSLGTANVLVKGGHLKGDPVDVLFDGRGFSYYKGKRLKGRKGIFHGTGCMLSAAVTALLARGYTVKDSVGLAKAYVADALKKRGARG